MDRGAVDSILVSLVFPNSFGFRNTGRMLSSSPLLPGRNFVCLVQLNVFPDAAALTLIRL